MNLSGLPLVLLGMSTAFTNPLMSMFDDVYDVLPARLTPDQRFISWQPKQSFKTSSPSQSDNRFESIFKFFFGLKKKISILLMLRMSETNDPKRNENISRS